VFIASFCSHLPGPFSIWHSFWVLNICYLFHSFTFWYTVEFLSNIHIQLHSVHFIPGAFRFCVHSPYYGAPPFSLRWWRLHSARLTVLPHLHWSILFKILISFSHSQVGGSILGILGWFIAWAGGLVGGSSYKMERDSLHLHSADDHLIYSTMEVPLISHFKIAILHSRRWEGYMGGHAILWADLKCSVEAIGGVLILSGPSWRLCLGSAHCLEGKPGCLWVPQLLFSLLEAVELWLMADRMKWWPVSHPLLANGYSQPISRHAMAFWRSRLYAMYDCSWLCNSASTYHQPLPTLTNDYNSYISQPTTRQPLSLFV